MSLQKSYICSSDKRAFSLSVGKFKAGRQLLSGRCYSMDITFREQLNKITWFHLFALMPHST